MAPQISMFPRQQEDKTLMGSGVFYEVRADMFKQNKLGVRDSSEEPRGDLMR
jgi:hypothetical protein